MGKRISTYLVWFFLFLSLSLLAYVFYKAEIVHQHSQFSFYLKYYLTFILFFFFWCIVLFFKDEIKTKIVTIVTSIIFSFYLVEALLTFVIFTDANVFLLKIFNQNNDFRSKVEIVKNLREKNIDVFPSTQIDKTVLYNGKKIMPLSPGISNKKTVLCNDYFTKYVTYTSDRYGFNNQDKDWNINIKDVVLIGDSFTHGVCVNAEENIAGQIKLATGKNVINLGLEGSGPLKQLAILKEYGKFTKSKNLVWIYYEGNDQFDLINEKKNKMLTNYLSSSFSQNLIDRQTETDSIITNAVTKILDRKSNTFIEKMKPIKLYGTRTFLKNYLTKAKTRDTYEKMNIKIDPIFENIIIEAKNTTNMWGGRILFVYIPEYNRYRKQVKNHDLYNNKAEIIKLVKKLNITTIDIHEKVFAKHTDPKTKFFLCKQCHYSAFGYRGVARAIVSELNISR